MFNLKLTDTFSKHVFPNIEIGDGGRNAGNAEELDDRKVQSTMSLLPTLWAKETISPW